MQARYASLGLDQYLEWRLWIPSWWGRFFPTSSATLVSPKESSSEGFSLEDLFRTKAKSGWNIGGLWILLSMLRSWRWLIAPIRDNLVCSLVYVKMSASFKPIETNWLLFFSLILIIYSECCQHSVLAVVIWWAGGRTWLAPRHVTSWMFGLSSKASPEMSFHEQLLVAVTKKEDEFSNSKPSRLNSLSSLSNIYTSQVTCKLLPLVSSFIVSWMLVSIVVLSSRQLVDCCLLCCSPSYKHPMPLYQTLNQ